MYEYNKKIYFNFLKKVQIFLLKLKSFFFIQKIKILKNIFIIQIT